MKKHNLLIMLLFMVIAEIFGQTTKYPFPNHTVYIGNHIKPSNYTQTQLDNHVQSFYDAWKLAYLKNDCGNVGEYYVFSGNGAKNVSEAQGYGMMIAAYFAGYDSNAQTYFDGLYRFYKAHPSKNNSYLMDWQQISCNDTASNDDDSASDGDVDIAFALLLAHEQWGSNGSIDYLTEAKAIIAAIMNDEINQSTWTVKLGDWSTSSSPNYFYGTRPSDFITDHFRAFSCFDSNWNNVVDTCYSLIQDIQTNYSATTGLIPDFIINVNTAAKPASASYLEGPYDGGYYYNACRVPWRLGTDYLINGDIRAKNALATINSWIVSVTSSDVTNISNGYALDGTAIYDWNDATFIGPFTVAAMLNTANQGWLNSLYENLLTENNLVDGDYYSNTLKLLSMLTISGNYWVPNCNTLKVTKPNMIGDSFTIYPNSTNGIVYIDYHATNDFSCRVLDMNGRILMDNINLDSGERPATIDISSLNSGIYLVSFQTNTTLITKKIVKE